MHVHGTLLAGGGGGGPPTVFNLPTPLSATTAAFATSANQQLIGVASARPARRPFAPRDNNYYKMVSKYGKL